MTHWVDFKIVREHLSFRDVLTHYGIEQHDQRDGLRDQIKIIRAFHSDHKPSCGVNLEKQVYNCFACDAGGNALDFAAHTKSHTYIQEYVLKSPDQIDIERVKNVIREEKALMYKKLILGNMAGLSVCKDMDHEDIKDGMIKFIEDEFTDIEANEKHPFWASRTKTEDKYNFLE